MAGTMSRDDLVDDLKASLHDAASVFTAALDADFDRLLGVAARDLGDKRPLIKGGTLTLAADTAAYAAPADLADFHVEHWTPGRMPQPWDASWPGQPPRQSVRGVAGARQIVFSPAPSAAHLAVLGSSFDYEYRAVHSIGAEAADTTIADADRGLLLLRAQAEAMREVALRNSAKPVSMRDGLSGQTRNSTPSALYDALLREYREAA